MLADLVQGPTEVCSGNSGVEGLLLGRYGINEMAKQFEEILQDVTTNQTTQLRQNS